jgi:hypothetical protein
MKFQVNVYYVEHMQQGWVVEAEDFLSCLKDVVSALERRQQQPRDEKMVQIEVVRVE